MATKKKRRKQLLSVEVGESFHGRLYRARVNGSKIASLSAVVREALEIGLEIVEARRAPAVESRNVRTGLEAAA